MRIEFSNFQLLDYHGRETVGLNVKQQNKHYPLMYTLINDFYRSRLMSHNYNE